MDEFGDKIKSKSIIKWVVLTMVLVVVISTAVFYYMVLANTTNIYRKVVTSTIDAAFEIVEPKKESKLNVDIDIDCNVNLTDKEEEKNNPTIKALNETTISINAQTDRDANKSVLHLKSKYGNEELFDASMFMDLKESKVYVLAKDLIENYIEIDVTEDDESTDKEIEVEPDNSDMRKAEKILKLELSNIITEDMCTKKEGAYILKTTNIQLVNNLKNAVESLSKNDEFLNCYENPKEILESLEMLAKVLDVELMDEYQIEVSLELGIFFKFKKVEVRVYDEKNIDIMLLVTENSIKYNIKKENKDSLKVNLETINSENTSNVKLSIDVVETGKFDLTMNVKYSQIEAIEEMNAYEVKKLDELSFIELMTLAEKFSETKLGELMEEINEYNSRGLIEMANKAVAATDVANLNDSLTLAYIDLKMAYATLSTFENLTTVVVEGKEYAGIEAYYKAVVPGIDENSAEYMVPEGYEVIFNDNGTALVIEKTVEQI